MCQSTSTDARGLTYQCRVLSFSAFLLLYSFHLLSDLPHFFWIEDGIKSLSRVSGVQLLSFYVLQCLPFFCFPHEKRRCHWKNKLTQLALGFPVRHAVNKLGSLKRDVKYPAAPMFFAQMPRKSPPGETSHRGLACASVLLLKAKQLDGLIFGD